MKWVVQLAVWIIRRWGIDEVVPNYESDHADEESDYWGCWDCPVCLMGYWPDGAPVSGKWGRRKDREVN